MLERLASATGLSGRTQKTSKETFKVLCNKQTLVQSCVAENLQLLSKECLRVTLHGCKTETGRARKVHGEVSCVHEAAKAPVNSRINAP